MNEREGYTLEVHYMDRAGDFTQVAERHCDFGDGSDVLAEAMDNPLPFLEDLWREFNVVDGNELPTLLGIRSMMVGDRVTIRFNYGADALGNVWHGHRTWVVAMVGWDLVDERSVIDNLEEV
jgi:hypothetical protein